MNFSLFNRVLNILFLILILNFICILCQSLTVKLQNNDSLNNSNISQVLGQSDQIYETILSNPSTKNILGFEELMSESTTKSFDSSDDSITEVNDMFKTTTESIILNDITTLTNDYSNQSNNISLNNQQITSFNNSKQILNNSHIIGEIEISKKINDSEIKDSTLFDISLDNSKDMPQMTSTQLSTVTADQTFQSDYNNTESEIMVTQKTSLNQYNNIVINELNNNKTNEFKNIENYIKNMGTTVQSIESTTEYYFETKITTELKNDEINATDLLFNQQKSLENITNVYSEDNVTQMTQVTKSGLQIDQGSLTDHYTEQNDEMDISQTTTTTTPSNVINTTYVNNEELIQKSLSSENYSTITTETNQMLGNIQINIENNEKMVNNSNDSLNDSSTEISNFEVNSSLTSNYKNSINISDLNLNKKLEESTKINSFKTMCTFGGWSAYRKGLGRFEVNDLKKEDFVLSRCSHLIYSFVALNFDTNVVSLDPKRELIPETGTFALLKNLKNQNKNLKLMISVGGWDTPADIWTYLLSNSTRRQKTVLNIIEFARKYSFDGLVISWFYPGAKWRGGHDSDKQNLIKFLQDFKSNTVWPDFELALMAPAIKEDIDSGYDIPLISEFVDHLLLMTYDYFGSWDSNVNHLAPLYSNTNKSDNLNVNFTLNYWLSNGADPNKIVLGLATYGRSFTLENSKNSQINSLSVGPGIAGPYTNRPGIMGFNEICETFLSTSGVQLEEDMHKVTPFIHLYDQWIGFEDELSVFIKATYALDNHLEGIFFWTLDLDDFNNKCEWGHFPLLRAALQAIYKTRDL